MASTLLEHDNGYTLTVLQHPIISWHRTYTRDDRVPAMTSDSLVGIHEWIPPYEAVSCPGYWSFGSTQKEAIATLTAQGAGAWGAHARRHLAATRKNPRLAVRLGSFEEYAAILTVSQVPLSFHDIFLSLVTRHLAAHSDDVEIGIATLDDQPIAAFVAVYCEEVRESVYIAGCFTRQGGDAHAMVALIAWWYERCAVRGITHANFGNICGARPLPFDDSIGYSIFKTHFNVHRVHRPGSRWRITLGKTKTTA